MSLRHSQVTAGTRQTNLQSLLTCSTARRIELQNDRSVTYLSPIRVREADSFTPWNLASLFYRPFAYSADSSIVLVQVESIPSTFYC